MTNIMQQNLRKIHFLIFAFNCQLASIFYQPNCTLALIEFGILLITLLIIFCLALIKNWRKAFSALDLRKRYKIVDAGMTLSLMSILLANIIPKFLFDVIFYCFEILSLFALIIGVLLPTNDKQIEQSR